MNEIKNIREPLRNKEYTGTVTLAITIIKIPFRDCYLGISNNDR